MNGDSSETGETVEEMTKEMELVEIGGEEFSLVFLADRFRKCQEDEEITVQEYITGYKEVYKFLCLMGTVFGWVGSDVYNKVVQLEKYLASDKKEHYRTVKSMIAYEVENNLIKTKKKDDPSGSRTLLRLHRALEYVYEFLSCLEDLEDDTYLGQVSKDAYEKSLQKYHPWIVQKAAKLGMGMLPSKKGLIQKIVPDDDQAKLEKARKDFPKAVEEMRKTYAKTQVFYKEHNLLDIP